MSSVMALRIVAITSLMTIGESGHIHLHETNIVDCLPHKMFQKQIPNIEKTLVCIYIYT